jgi:hypothetical protein
LRNDTAYQQRKAAEAGARISGSRQTSTIAPSPSTATIELEKPKRPEESSAAFLAYWDLYIRLANLAELLLAAMTLIYIRNRSAKTNSPAVFIPIVGASSRTPAFNPPFRKTNASYQKEKTQKTHASYDFEGLKRLREALKDISFRLAGRCFKTDVRGDAVWIRMVTANNSTQETIASIKAKLSILDDALKMAPDTFRERLEKFLRQSGFEI